MDYAGKVCDMGLKPLVVIFFNPLALASGQQISETSAKNYFIKLMKSNSSTSFVTDPD